jgi:hypothetical protein
MFASGNRENRSDNDSLAIALEPVVFPLPGGRSVARPAWFAISLEERPRTDGSAAATSSAERRRTMARRLSRPKMPVGYGELAGPSPTLAVPETGPT